MRKVVLLAILAGVSWWYFIGGRTITEAHVERFYRDLEHATLSRNPEALCALLDEDFQSVGTVSMAGQRSTVQQDKAQACEAYDEMYENFALLGDKMGGMLQLDSGYKINSIAIQSDSKSATVDFSSSLDVAGTIMNIRSRSTDTLIRRNGKVLMLRSEGKGRIWSGG
jgi:hypothetical protein